MPSVRAVLALVVGTLLAGQGVATAFASGETTQLAAAVGTSYGGDKSEGDDGEPASDSGESESDDPNPTGDDGDPGAGANPDPPATSAQSPTVQALTRSVATSRAKSVLSRRFGRVYTHGNHRRVSCRRQGASSYVCALSWRYRQQRYNGHAIVSRSGLVKTHVVSRRAS
jgi:hypothetical protein